MSSLRRKNLDVSERSYLLSSFRPENYKCGFHTALFCCDGVDG